MLTQYTLLYVCPSQDSFVCRGLFSAKVKFILMVIKGELKVNNRKRADLLEDLKKKGFKPMSEIQKGALGNIFSTSISQRI